jgi:hypothetical protein
MLSRRIQSWTPGDNPPGGDLGDWFKFINENRSFQVHLTDLAWCPSDLDGSLSPVYNPNIQDE